MIRPISHFAGIALLALLTACAPPHKKDMPPTVQAIQPGYEAVQDGDFLIPGVEARLFMPGMERSVVPYNGDEDAGTIVVDTFARKLYHVMDGGLAERYAIAVGREGLSFRGSGVIGRLEEWPSWQPTGNMIATRPDLYAAFAGGLPGGLDNPLGARAMYLFRGGRDSHFRIHGTIDNASIGHATSAGCIRLFNQDAIDLYGKVEVGTKVKVRTLDESVTLEGPYMDDAYGRAVPDTPDNQAQKVIDAEKIAAEEAANPELAAFDAAARAAEEAARRQAGGN